MKLRTYLGDSFFWKTLARIALPIALQNLLSSSFTLVDTLMVGQLGDIPLSSVGMAGQFTFFLSMIIFGLTSGVTMFSSQFWGANDVKSIRKVYGIALLIGCSASVIFNFVGAVFPDKVIFIFNRDPEVMKIGTEYLSIACYSYIAIALNFVFMSILRSTEEVKLPLFATLFSTLANCVLNYIFIFGKFGVPAFGAKGAAIATLISSWISPVFIFTVSVIRKNILIAPIRDLFGFDLKFFREFIRRVLPVITNETLWGCGTMLFNVVFSNLGAGNYAAVTILRTFENISLVFFVGLSNAASVIIGKQTGGGEIDSAVRDSKRFFVLVPLISLAICSIIITFRTQIVGIFDLGGAISDSTLKTAVTILCIYALEMPIRNIPYILICGIFRPGGETKKGMKFDLCFQWLISLPVTAITAFVLKLPFPLVFALMYVAEDWLKAVFCVRYFFSEEWIKPVTSLGIEGLKKYKLNKCNKV